MTRRTTSSRTADGATARTEAELRNLMLAGLAGDAAAHRDLLDKLSRHLRALFRRRLARYGRGPDEAEDLLQDTLIAIHTRRHTYDPSAPLLAWVHGIARYKMIDLLRATDHAIADIRVEDAADLVAAEDDTAEVDTALDLHRALAALPSHFRLPIEFVKLQGMSVAEAAARTGMSNSAVKIGIHRGIRKLATILSGERR